VGGELAVHWNGHSWQRVPVPGPAHAVVGLEDVLALSAKDVWAVGFSEVGFNPDKTLVEHWNGTKWTIVPSPSPGKKIAGSDLTGIVALSPKNAWATGEFFDKPDSLHLILQWNGTKWTTVPVQVASTPDTVGLTLFGIAALNPNDIWAVGSTNNSTGTHVRTWIEHWDGSNWTRSPSPNP
jgi:hypothetical protein